MIAIGNELLAGRTADSNFVELARLAGELGVRFARHLTIGDRQEEIRAALEAEAPDASWIVLSGGLGPTADDLTREAVADFAGVPLVEDAAVVARLEARYAALGCTLSGTARRQALLPQGVELLPNPVGLAPGLWLAARGTVICALPGVPGEFLSMAQESLLPRLAASGRWPRTVTAVLRTVGLPESEVADRVEGITGAASGSSGVRSEPGGPEPGGSAPKWAPLDLTGVELAYLPHAGMVDLRIVAHGGQAEARVAAIERELTLRLGGSVYARGEQTMAEVVGDLLRARGLRVALAESCTGGLLGAQLTAVPGSSDYFAGGVVAYSNGVKGGGLGGAGAIMRPTVRSVGKWRRRWRAERGSGSEPSLASRSPGLRGQVGDRRRNRWGSSTWASRPRPGRATADCSS